MAVTEEVDASLASMSPPASGSKMPILVRLMTVSLIAVKKARRTICMTTASDQPGTTAAPGVLSTPALLSLPTCVTPRTVPTGTDTTMATAGAPARRLPDGPRRQLECWRLHPPSSPDPRPTCGNPAPGAPAPNRAFGICRDPRIDRRRPQRPPADQPICFTMRAYQ